MRFKLGCKLTYSVGTEMPFLFNIYVQSFDDQLIEHEILTLSPSLTPNDWIMPESGNRHFRLIMPPGDLVVTYQAQVTFTPQFENPDSVSEMPIGDLPLSVYTHLYPSRYCQSDKLERFTRSTFGNLKPGYDRVNGICNWIHDYIFCEGGVSDALTSAFDTVTQRAGVCRDFAHLAIALCRSLDVPARYVSAYAFRLDPPDFHAVFETYLAGPNGRVGIFSTQREWPTQPALYESGSGATRLRLPSAVRLAVMQAGKPEVWIEAEQTAPAATTQAVRISN